MWRSRTKRDLIIEVWEKLDCESVGRVEIEAIEIVVGDHFGESAVDPPMVLARTLADEGAELRHSEIMELHVERASDRPYDAAFQNILKISDLHSAAGTIRRLENLRRKYAAGDDKTGLRLVRETAQQGKQMALDGISKNTPVNIASEIAQWFTVWLQNPDVFETWLGLRVRSSEFKDMFGPINDL